jgi:DNA repair photolyase
MKHNIVNISNPAWLTPTGNICNKPVFTVPTSGVVNLNSGFQHKYLCDGPTFTAGSACAYSCTYCFVPDILRRNQRIKAILEQFGYGHSEIVVRRENAVTHLHEALLSRGSPKFPDPNDQRVVYSSPLVDPAASMDLARETLALCLEILRLTHWQIRLLSKSPLLAWIAEHIPAEYRSRMIFGLSTGTLDNGVARAIEVGAPLVSKRLEALHQLQDGGFRTYGMICPILPQKEPEAYAARLAKAVRVDQCEHVWAEVLNVRGASMLNTIAALRAGGHTAEAQLLQEVSENREAWEIYAREMFLALANLIPARKLRFLQYVKKSTLDWWTAQAPRGAVVLGNAVKGTTN